MVTTKQDKILQLALGDVLTNAGTVAREGTKGGGRRTAAAWCVVCVPTTRFISDDDEPTLFLY